jgi:alcohol dehydrogenase
MLPTRTFLIPPGLITGTGSSEMVGEEINRLGLKKGLLVTDEVLGKMEMLEGIKKTLRDAYRESGCEFLLAVGGGSAIDTAKAIAALATNEGAIEDYMGLNKLTKKAAPLIAVPTTGGTGSEVTIFTIITDTKTFHALAD